MRLTLLDDRERESDDDATTVDYYNENESKCSNEDLNDLVDLANDYS